jgi:uncharacterized NAD(P)/FAD-binding protein YdhS
LRRDVRASVTRELADGRSWHGIIDSIRPYTDEIWQGLSVDEKRRFMRHLRSLGGVSTSHARRRFIARSKRCGRSGQLRVICGRLASASTDDSGEITVRILGGSPARETPISATRVINCTGPNNDPRKPLEEGDAVETDPQKYVADLLMAQLEIPDWHEPGKRWCTRAMWS